MSSSISTRIFHNSLISLCSIFADQIYMQNTNVELLYDKQEYNEADKDKSQQSYKHNKYKEEMNRPQADSDIHLMEVLEASKAKLAALTNDIQFAKEDNEKYKKLLEDAENEKTQMDQETLDLKNEFQGAQEKNKELTEKANELKKLINRAKQEMAMVIEEGEHKEKELIGQIKKAQEEQKKIQAQYKELQKESENLEKDREKMAKLQESLDRKQKEIDGYKRELEEHQEKDTNRILSLEDHAKQIKDLSYPQIQQKGCDSIHIVYTLDPQNKCGY
eukprot:TRINITY_DN1511_c0_g1_i1.p3 TRINITY_DN1511_c0_g1~~TRINITY_DN1511_c0_g1_i1.p3  ORF type:complete len:276 (+),score=57.38 TRINITY_DN1511_c0_g1_i1:1993-2820(+)